MAAGGLHGRIAPLTKDDRLTRQELTWLLAQEARTAATALREGVRPSKPEMPAVTIESMPAVETNLDALDASISMLSQLQSSAPSKARRGRIDLAALLYEVAPGARITMEPGAGTEVFGDEADLRRMLHVLVSEVGSLGGADAPELSIRRDEKWVRLSVELGPDSSAGATMERRWLSRMATRHGGRLELEGGTQSLVLPADMSTEETDQLRKELEQAQQLGEAYARELAAAFTAGDIPSAESPETPSGSERFEAMASLAAAISRPLRRVFEELRAASGQARDSLGEGAPLAKTLGKLTSSGYELVGELDRLSEVPLAEPAEVVDLSELARETVDAAEGRAARHSVKLKLTASTAVEARVQRSAVRLAVRSLLDHAIAASPQGSTVSVEVARDGDGARLTIDDGGPVVPPASRGQLLGHLADPTAVGRPAGASLLVAGAVAGYLEGDLAMGEADSGQARLTLRLPL